VSSTRALDLGLDPELAAQLVPARRLEERRGRRGSGVPGLDALLGGGWPRAALCELRGRRSSGRTAVLLASLARAIAAGESAALVDTGGTLDPRRATACGVDLSRLLWIRCGHADARVSRGELRSPELVAGGVGDPSRVPMAIKAADLVVAAGGFDLVALDLGDARPRAPTAAWVRLKHGAERQGTTIVIATPAVAAGTFAAAAVELAAEAPRFFVDGPPLFDGVRARARRVRGGRGGDLAGGEEEACGWLAFSSRS
jgi:protein ImuA